MTLRLLVLSIAVSVMLLALWIFSYRAYGLITYEAYSGVGTELASERGQLVFYHFDSYQPGSGPPQEWSWGLLKPESRQGKRLAVDFDLSQGPSWCNRLGFGFMTSTTAITGHTKVLFIAVPYWFLFGAVSVPAVLLGMKSRRTQPQPEAKSS